MTTGDAPVCYITKNQHDAANFSISVANRCGTIRAIFSNQQSMIRQSHYQALRNARVRWILDGLASVLVNDFRKLNRGERLRLLLASILSTILRQELGR